MRHSTIILVLGLCIAVAGLLYEAARSRSPSDREPTIVYLDHSELEGVHMAHFELRVPPDRRLFVDGPFARRQALVGMNETGEDSRRAPQYHVTPAEKHLGPETRFRFSIVEPELTQWRLEYEVFQLHLGAGSLPYRLRRAWRTKRFSELGAQVISCERIKSEMITSCDITKSTAMQRTDWQPLRLEKPNLRTTD